VLAVLFRDPASRLVSALNYVMVAQKHAEAHRACADRSEAWFATHLDAYQSTTRGLFAKYFVADRPYSRAFNVTSEKDVLRTLAFLERHFIVGLTVKMDSFLGRLSKSFANDRYAAFSYQKKQHVAQTYQGHVAKPYCRKADLPLSTVSALNARVGTDLSLYRGVVELSAKQRTTAGKDLPAHFNPSCDVDVKRLGMPGLYLPDGGADNFALDYSTAVLDYSPRTGTVGVSKAVNTALTTEKTKARTSRPGERGVSSSSSSSEGEASSAHRLVDLSKPVIAKPIAPFFSLPRRPKI